MINITFAPQRSERIHVHAFPPLTDLHAAFLARFCALFGLFIALLTLAMSPVTRAAAHGWPSDLLESTVLTAVLAGLFVLALVALRLHDHAVAKMVWLLCGVVELGAGLVLLVSSVGIFMGAAGAG